MLLAKKSIQTWDLKFVLFTLCSTLRVNLFTLPLQFLHRTKDSGVEESVAIKKRLWAFLSTKTLKNWQGIAWLLILGACLKHILEEANAFRGSRIALKIPWEHRVPKALSFLTFVQYWRTRCVREWRGVPDRWCAGSFFRPGCQWLCWGREIWSKCP